MKLISIMFAALALLGSVSAVAGDYVIHAGRLIDGNSSKAMEQMSVLVKDQQIVGIEKGYVAATDGQEVIDLKNHTLMPGLMDMHTHLDINPNPAEALTDAFLRDEADRALRATDYVEDVLMAGFTTVRNLGGITTLNLRDAVNAGYIPGPRIYAAGTAIATTGGHADQTNGLNRTLSHLMGPPGPTEGVVNGPYEARQAVRQRYKDGSDVIKLTVTGGVGSLARSGDNTQFMADELEAIMQAANDYNFVVAVHAHGAEGMKRAVEAGVHSVEHGTYMTPEIMKLMKKKGTYYVPTISAGKWVAKHADFYPPMIQPKAREIGPKIQGTFAKAYKAGVKIAFGADNGVFPHALSSHEFVYMVEAGMPEMEAIQAATVNAADLLRISDKLGSVEVGKLADLVAVEGNPLENIELMTDVKFVMKDGVVYKNQ